MGEMQWRSRYPDGEKLLHLRLSPGEPWKPYTAFQQFKRPDYDVPGGSKGWATYQFLRDAGWKLLPSDGVLSLKDGGDRDG